MFDCVFKFLFGTNGNGTIDRTALWTGIAALGAIGAIFFAWIELGGTAKTTRADFAKRFIDSFFTEETRTLFSLLLNSALEFKVLAITGEQGEAIDELPFFEIKKEIANQLKGIVSPAQGKIGYSAFEIDDLLLGHFEDIGWYEKRGLIDQETISEMFGYHISECFQSKEIQKYLQHSCNDGKYEHFKRLGGTLSENPHS